MYPLPIVLLGVDEGVISGLRRELWNGSAAVESEFHSAYMAIDCLRHYKNQPRLLIVQIGADFQPDTIQRLAATLRGWPILALLSGGRGRTSSESTAPVRSRSWRSRSTPWISRRPSA